MSGVRRLRRLAFAAVERAGRTVRSELYIVAPDQAPKVAGAHPEHHVIYMHWAPDACIACPDLVYLIEGENALDLRRVDMTPGALTPENRLLDEGRPFYFSWSPDGREMLWHRGGARRLNAEAQLSLHDLAARRTQTLAPAPGSFLAPAWSPDGSAWLTVTEREAGNGLLLVTPEEQTVIATGPADIAFAWSPDGARIAYARRDAPTAPAYGAIHVHDVATGQTTRITAPGFHPRAFFWSPTGDRLAYINWLAIPAAHWSQWRVYDFENAAERGYPAFNPTPHLRMIIGSFNQYAQSHRFWSADGRYLLYTDRDKALTERIWVVDTLAEEREEPIFVAQGSLGVWSWDAPPEH